MKKFVKYLLPLISCSTIIAATTFMPFASEIISNSFIHKNTNTATRDGISYTQQMMLDNVWKNDKYDATQGYVYTPPYPGINDTEGLNGYVVFDTDSDPHFKNDFKAPSNRWLVSLDKNGLQVNGAMINDYNNIKAFQYVYTGDKVSDPNTVPQFPNVVNGEMYNRKDLSQTAAVNYYTYQNAGIYSQSTEESDMTFGTWTSDTDHSTKEFTLQDKGLSQTIPYISLKMPTFTVTGEYKGLFITETFPFKESLQEAYPNNFIESKLSGYDKDGEGIAPGNNPWLTKEDVRRYYEWTEQTIVPPSSVLYYKYAIEIQFHTSEIIVFRDYDGDALIKTLLFDSAWNGDLQTEYKALTVSDSLVIEGKAASEQLSSVAANLTLQGENIPYQFLRDANLELIADNVTGKITANFTPKSMFDKEGKIVPYNGKPILLDIGGFEKSKTLISTLLQYPQDVVVDKWKGLITNEEGFVSQREILENYLDLSTVPQEATLKITNEAYDYINGIVTFDIWSDHIILDNNRIIKADSTVFKLSLQLTPRITKFTKINDNPDDLTADLIKNKLFNANGALNLKEFKKYQKITAPFENANYTLVNDSYEFHTGDGTVSFAIWPNAYYGKDGEVKAGWDTNEEAYFKFNLQVNRTPTMIEKQSFDSPIRVDKFINEVSTNGIIKNDKIDKLSAFNKYIKTEHVPSDSILSIGEIEILDYDRADDEYTSTDYTNTIKFVLTLSSYNETVDGIVKPIKEKEIPLTLTLDAQHDGTDVVEITPVNSDRVDIFKKKIETLNDKELIAYLKHYVDFTSLREDAIVTTDIVADSYDPYNGTIQLNINIQNYYRKDNNDFDDTSAAFNNLSFDLPLAPTEVKVIKAKDLNVRLDRFVKTFANEITGEVTDRDVLQQYVSFDVWDPSTTLKIDLPSIVMDNASGAWSGDLIMGEANDLNSQRVSNRRFPLKFTFQEKYDPTVIEQREVYPQVQLDNFKSLLFDENNVATPAIYDYLDIYSLPKDAEIILLEEPIIDYPNAQITIKVRITSLYDEDSDQTDANPIIRATPPVFDRTYTFDLLSPETKITQAENYNTDPRVDRFAATIKSLTNDNLKTALANYVNFDGLPANTELSIDQKTFSITNIPGTLAFNVLASRYFDADGYLQTDTKPFPITLNFANKYDSTLITAKTTYIATHRVDRFIAALGASQTNPEITNLAVLNQYVDVISIPENAKLSIDYTKVITSNKNTGEMNFWIKTDKYYNDPDCDLKDDGFSFPITLQLDVVHQPTSIKQKPDGAYDKSIRVDRFLRTFINSSNNLVTNRAVLEQYVDIVSLPPNARLYVSNAKPDFKSGQITFNLIASQYYEATDSDLVSDSITENKNPFAISLQLTPRIDPTNFSARTDYSKDNLLVHELTNYIAPNGVVNLERFKAYIDIVSLPNATKIELQEVSYSTNTGNIEYNVIVDQYYDADGDLQTKTATYPVSLQLNPVYAETKIEALSKYPTSVDITTFKNYVVDTNGNVIVDNLQKFVSIESLPPTSQLTIVWGAETATTIEFIVNASKYYNSQNRLADDKDFSIKLTLTGDVRTTNIVAWENYPPIGAHQFFNLVNPNNKINYTQLNKYLDLSTVPFNADLSISKPVSNSKTGLVTFDITTSTWYDDNGVLQPTPKTFEIALQLTPKYPETYLFGIQSIDKNTTLEDFWAQISTYDVLDQVKLAQYVNLDTLVPNTKLQYLNPIKHFDGSISFDLVVDRYYDANGTENFGKKLFKITLSNLIVDQQASQVQDLTWVYVVIALLSTASIGLIWFLIAKNRKNNEE